MSTLTPSSQRLPSCDHPLKSQTGSNSPNHGHLQDILRHQTRPLPRSATSSQSPLSVSEPCMVHLDMSRRSQVLTRLPSTTTSTRLQFDPIFTSFWRNIDQRLRTKRTLSSLSKLLEGQPHNLPLLLLSKRMVMISCEKRTWMHKLF